MSHSANEAGKQARAVLVKTGLTNPPIPVEEIARLHGILVKHLPLDDEMSGMSFIKDGVSVIVVNSGHHPNRQRFTIAHELGHHILHADYLRDNVHVDKVIFRNSKSSDGTQIKEIEANAFAAELLMPASKLKQYVHLDFNDEAMIAAIARVFRVSTAAMSIRLGNLD